MYIGCRVSLSVLYYFGKEKEIVTVTDHLIFYLFAAGIKGKCTPFVFYFAYYFVYWSSSDPFWRGINFRISILLDT
ncbi:LOW QUALITY PROTEIN: hypothetical protein BT93_L5029 [Corymbia citriodora subsp. variegata]|uniref:Uncharacterized protein n=1 Tax=Corymbia citriodora subsp. variegata TaxID=360336 RepID=A0A8T0CTF9_CORYI|nr:LOW QUALITY PROTEIN: hypothetical protein BT93_L5029 [Corymbia citriodora subsp. variegata]